MFSGKRDVLWIKSYGNVKKKEPLDVLTYVRRGEVEVQGQSELLVS